MIMCWPGKKRTRLPLVVLARSLYSRHVLCIYHVMSRDRTSGDMSTRGRTGLYCDGWLHDSLVIVTLHGGSTGIERRRARAIAQSQTAAVSESRDSQVRSGSWQRTKSLHPKDSTSVSPRSGQSG